MMSRDKLANLYGIFRKKMHEVYRKNRKHDPFNDSMPQEFNAWQDYLRNSLSLSVVDAEHGEDMDLVVDKSKKVWAKILNPSNGASFSHECILVPEELAEKALVLGDLPDRV